MSNLSVCLSSYFTEFFIYMHVLRIVTKYILHLLWILLKHHFYFISYKKVQIMISKTDLDGSVFFIQGSYFLFLEIITSRYFQIAYYTFLILKISNLLEFLFFLFCFVFYSYVFNLISVKNMDVKSIRCNSTLYNLWGKSLPT